MYCVKFEDAFGCREPKTSDNQLSIYGLKKIVKQALI